MHEFAVGDTAHHQGRVWEVTAVAGNRVTVRCGAWPQERYTTVRADRLRFVRAGSSRSRRRADEQPVFGEKEAEALVRRVVDRARSQAATGRQAEITRAHESGHAVAACLFGMDVTGVSVHAETMRDHGAHGMTLVDYAPGQVPAEDVVVQLLAGGAAARMLVAGYTDDDDRRGCWDDDDQARTLLGGPVPDRLRRRAAEFVAEHRAEVEAVVELLERSDAPVVLGSDVADTVRDTRAGLAVLRQSLRSGRPSVEERSARFALDAERSDGLTLSGYAAVFDVPTTIRDQAGDFDEVVSRGAFARSLRERTPVLMFEHGRHPVIGTMPLGVVERAVEDAKGLHVTARLTDNWMVQPVRDAIRDKAVSGMSFRFSVPVGGDRWQTRSGKPDLRTVVDADVTELGPVVFPAYRETSVSVRADGRVVA